MYVEPKDYKEVRGFVLCTKYVHMSVGELEAIPNHDIEGDYEIMVVDKETEKYFYGMPFEGMGLVDCMIDKKDCRPFTEKELEAYKFVRMGMYGSHSGKLSYTYNASIDVDLMAKRDTPTGAEHQ